MHEICWSMFVDHLASREIVVEFCSIVNGSAKYKYTLGSIAQCFV